MPLARADRAYDIATIVSELANVDHATAMKAITGQSEEPMVVLFRSLDATWETFEAVLQLRAKRNRRNYVQSPTLATGLSGDGPLDRAPRPALPADPSLLRYQGSLTATSQASAPGGSLTSPRLSSSAAGSGSRPRKAR